MKHTRWLRATALALCSVFVFSACSFLGTSPEPEPGDTERQTIPYSEMEYTRPDTDAIKARLAEITEEIKTAENFDTLIELDDESSDLVSHFATMRTLAMLKTYHDSSDIFFEEEYRYCQDRGVELSNLVNDLNRAIIEGPFAEQYREHYGDYVFKSIESSLLLNSPEVEPLKQRRNQLNIDYNTRLSTLTLEQDGRSYTITDILSSDNYSTYLALINAYYKENVETFTEIYTEMVALDKEIAQTLGFESVAEMYYLTYSRDYTPDDALGYCESAKEIFVPLAKQVDAVQTYTIDMELDKVKTAMPKALAKVDKEFADIWKQMIEYGVYDFEALPGKQSGVAFTTELYDYDSPFIYSYWEEDFYSTTTLMHEFGHFIDTWKRYDDTVVFNLDIAETYSQGLELLMEPHFKNFTRYPQEAQEAHLQGFTNPLTYQAMLEEFQQRLYKMEDLNSDSISLLYGQMLEEYGLTDDYPLLGDDGRDYSWFRITHLFDSPFYTISYWTSACVALQIWAVSRDDYDAAVQLYRDLQNADQNQPFTQLVTGVGLKDPGDKSTLLDIADNFIDFYGLAGSRAAA